MVETLNELEMTVLKLTAAGYNLKQMCTKMGLDEKQVEGYRQKIMIKTGTNSMLDAINESSKKGWIYT